MIKTQSRRASMDWMCGPFQPELLPDWFSKVGPAIAAFVAVGVFAMNRWYVKRDLRAKRRVLRVMLVELIRRTCLHASLMQERIRCSRSDLTMLLLMPRGARRGRLSLRGTDRLFVLQADLLGLADKGDEIVAEFIESCRLYRYQLDELANVKQPPKDISKVVWNQYAVLVEDITADFVPTLIKLQEKGKVAISHLQRQVSPISVRWAARTDRLGDLIRNI
jgi:hypothetical protein